MFGQYLDTGRMAKIDSVDPQSVGPLFGVVDPSESLGRIAGESRCDDDVSAGAQQLQSRLKANLDSSSSDQCVTVLEVRRLDSFDPIELGAIGTERVVEVVDEIVVVFADVAIARSVQGAVEFRRVDIHVRWLGSVKRLRSCCAAEQQLAVASANPGRRQNAFIAVGVVLIAGASPLPARSSQLAARGASWMSDSARRSQQAVLNGLRRVEQQSTVVRQLFEHVERRGDILRSDGGVGHGRPL
jgi:hypothetical protein